MSVSAKDDIRGSLADADADAGTEAPLGTPFGDSLAAAAAAAASLLSFSFPFLAARAAASRSRCVFTAVDGAGVGGSFSAAPFLLRALALLGVKLLLQLFSHDPGVCGRDAFPLPFAPRVHAVGVSGTASSTSTTSGGDIAAGVAGGGGGAPDVPAGVAAAAGFSFSFDDSELDGDARPGVVASTPLLRLIPPRVCSFFSAVVVVRALFVVVVANDSSHASTKDAVNAAAAAPSSFGRDDDDASASAIVLHASSLARFPSPSPPPSTPIPRATAAPIASPSARPGSPPSPPPSSAAGRGKNALETRSSAPSTARVTADAVAMTTLAIPNVALLPTHSSNRSTAAPAVSATSRTRAETNRATRSADHRIAAATTTHSDAATSATTKDGIAPKMDGAPAT